MAEIASKNSPNGYNLYEISELESFECPRTCVFRNRVQPDAKRPYEISDPKQTSLTQRAIHVACRNKRITTCDGWHPRRNAILQTGAEHNHLKMEQLTEILPCFNNGDNTLCGDAYGTGQLSPEEEYRRQLRARSNGYGEP